MIGAAGSFAARLPGDRADRGECVHGHGESFAGEDVGGVVGAQVNPAQADDHSEESAGGDRGDPAARVGITTVSAIASASQPTELAA